MNPLHNCWTYFAQTLPSLVVMQSPQAHETTNKGPKAEVIRARQAMSQILLSQIDLSQAMRAVDRCGPMDDARELDGECHGARLI